MASLATPPRAPSAGGTVGAAHAIHAAWGDWRPPIESERQAPLSEAEAPACRSRFWLRATAPAPQAAVRVSSLRHGPVIAKVIPGDWMLTNNVPPSGEKQAPANSE